MLRKLKGRRLKQPPLSREILLKKIRSQVQRARNQEWER